jgi:hypothetical protein
MGAIADAFVAFSQPLIDQTDGSLEQLNRAMTIGQLCYNLALMPKDQREGAIREMQSTLRMDDAEFEDFRRSVVLPMMRRHEEMFPQLHRREEAVAEGDLQLQINELDAARDELPVAAIEELRNNREQAIPLLIEALRQAIEQARAGRSPEGQAHFFAFFLLWEFKARQALPVIVEALSLPGELPFDLFEDAVHESGRAVACLADDPLEVIDQLVREPKHNEFVRWVMLGALKYLVRDGKLPLSDAVARLRGYLELLIEEQHFLLAGAAIDELTNLFPLGDEQDAVMQQIRDAFAKEQVAEEMIDLELVERESRRTEAERFKDLEPTEVDAIEELQDWASFSEPADDLDESDYPGAEDDGERPWNVASAWQHPDDREEPSLPPVGTIVRSEPHVGRNDPCPCGSGRKFKKCCGAHR